MFSLSKFADDMALVTRLQEEKGLAQYFLLLDLLNSWFQEGFLGLNISKTEELVFDSGKNKTKNNNIHTSKKCSNLALSTWAQL